MKCNTRTGNSVRCPEIFYYASFQASFTSSDKILRKDMETGTGQKQIGTTFCLAVRMTLIPPLINEVRTNSSTKRFATIPNHMPGWRSPRLKCNEMRPCLRTSWWAAIVRKGVLKGLAHAFELVGKRDLSQGLVQRLYLRTHHSTLRFGIICTELRPLQFGSGKSEKDASLSSRLSTVVLSLNLSF